MLVEFFVGKCGAVYHKNVDKGRHYYNCSNKRKYGVDKCNNHNLYVTKINELITPENYRRDLYNSNIAYGQELVMLSIKLGNSISSMDKEKVLNLKKELDLFVERKNRIINMYELSYINENEFKQKIEPINKQVEYIEKAIKQFSKNNDEIINDLMEIQKTMQQFKTDNNLLSNMSNREFAKKYTREIIISDIKTIIVNEDKTVNIKYKTFDKYYNLREKHRDLLNIYVKNCNVNDYMNEISRQIEDLKNDTYENNMLKLVK